MRSRTARCRSSASRMRWRAIAGSRNGSSRRRGRVPLDRRGASDAARTRRASGRRRRNGPVCVPDAQAARAPAGRSHRHRRARQPVRPRRVRRRRDRAAAARLRSRVRRQRLRARPRTSRVRRTLRAARLSARLERSGRSPRSSPRAAATAASSCCRCSMPAIFAATPKVFIGYSDNTSLLIVADAGVRHRGVSRSDARRALRARGGGLRPRHVPALPDARRAGRRDHASAGRGARSTATRPGMLVGGTLTQLVASLGTPFAFDPPDGCVLFLDDVGGAAVSARSHADAAPAERDPRARLGASSSTSCPRCDEPGGKITARQVTVRVRARGFPRSRCCSACRRATPTAPTLTLPFGVRARVIDRRASGADHRGSGGRRRVRESDVSETDSSDRRSAGPRWRRWRRC